MKPNYNKGYLPLKSDVLSLVDDKPRTVTKHFIKKIKNIKHYSGKFYLPTTCFPVLETKTEYYFIDLLYPIHYLTKDWWGFGKLIFIKDEFYNSEKKESITFSSSFLIKELCSNLQIHKRTSKNKIYLSFKIPMSKKEIGKKFYFFKYKPKISLSYYNERKGDVDENRKRETINGKLYVLFEKKPKEECLKYSMELKKKGGHKRIKVLDLLNKGNDTLQIANELNISENAVWKNIANCFKKGDIDTKQLTHILHKHSSRDVMDLLILKLEGERKRIEKNNKQLLRNPNLSISEKERYMKTAFYDYFKIKLLSKIYEAVTTKKLNQNHGECILLLYKKIRLDNHTY